MAAMSIDDYNAMINDARIRAIMKAQEQIESNGGRNVDHQELNYGMHKGTAAKGRYGIMPATLRDFAKNMPDDKEAQEAAGMEDEGQLKDYFANHPQLEDRLALQYIKQANKSMGGDYDPEKITYAWQWGQNKTPTDFEKDKNKPEVQARLSKIKGIFKDPYPPQGPVALNPSVNRQIAETQEPNPMPNMTADVADASESSGSIPSAELPNTEEKSPAPVPNASIQEQSQVEPTPKEQLMSSKSKTMPDSDEPVQNDLTKYPRLNGLLKIKPIKRINS